MTVFNDTRRFLVQRKLWPVAILLVAAAAAVPTLLSKDPAGPAAPAVAAVKSGDVDARHRADRRARERRRPCRSPACPRLAQEPLHAQRDPDPDADPGLVTDDRRWHDDPGGGASAPGTTAGSPGGTPVAPGFTTPLAPVTPKKKYELFELTVRFGDATSDTAAPAQGRQAPAGAAVQPRSRS